MRLNSPLISILLPNYNHAAYITGQLDAMLAQSYSAIEIIVIDDASTDHSVEVIQSYAQRDPRVRFYQNEQNQGVVNTLDRALELAQGEYVYSSAADDLVLPELFAEAITWLQHYPQAGLFCCHPALLDDRTGQIDYQTDKFHLSDRPCYASPQQLLAVFDSDGLWIAAHAAIIKREALIAAGKFRPDLKWHTDWFPLHVIAFRYGICYSPKPLAAYRILPNSYSSKPKTITTQRMVFDALLTWLQDPSYADVLPYFQQSRLFAQFGFPILYTAFRDRRHWSFLPTMPYRQILIKECRSNLAKITPEAIKRVYRKLRYRHRPLLSTEHDEKQASDPKFPQ